MGNSHIAISIQEEPLRSTNTVLHVVDTYTFRTVSRSGLYGQTGVD